MRRFKKSRVQALAVLAVTALAGSMIGILAGGGPATADVTAVDGRVVGASDRVDLIPNAQFPGGSLAELTPLLGFSEAPVNTLPATGTGALFPTCADPTLPTCIPPFPWQLPGTQPQSIQPGTPSGVFFTGGSAQAVVQGGRIGQHNGFANNSAIVRNAMSTLIILRPLVELTPATEVNITELQANCYADGDGSKGATKINGTYNQLGGTPILLPSAPPPNTTVTLTNGDTIILNRQTRTDAPGKAQIVVDGMVIRRNIILRIGSQNIAPIIVEETVLGSTQCIAEGPDVLQSTTSGPSTTGTTNTTTSSSSTSSTSSTSTTSTTVPGPNISKNFSPSTTAPGGTSTINLVVSNTGTSPTSGPTTVTDNVDSDLVTGQPSGGGFTCTSGQNVSCQRASGLAVGESVTIQIPITVTSTASGCGSNNNTASLNAGGATRTSNTATLFVSGGVCGNVTTTTLQPGGTADLGVDKQHTTNFVQNANGTWTMTVTNFGPSTSGNITLTDQLPAGVTFVSATGGGFTCTQNGQQVSCTRGPLGAGQTAVVTMIVHVTAQGGSVLTNGVSISGANDPDLSDNTDSDTVVVDQAGTPVTTISGANNQQFCGNGNQQQQQQEADDGGGMQQQQQQQQSGGSGRGGGQQSGGQQSGSCGGNNQQQQQQQ